MSRRMFHKTSSLTLAVASISLPSALRAAAPEDTERVAYARSRCNMMDSVGRYVADQSKHN